MSELGQNLDAPIEPGAALVTAVVEAAPAEVPNVTPAPTPTPTPTPTTAEAVSLDAARRSKYVGVRPAKHGKPGWITVINSSLEGKKVRKEFGPFESEEEAARKYDEEAAIFSRPLNFPLEGSIVPQAIKEPSSKFMGVSWHKPAKRWTASITELGKNKHLGYYPSEEQAARSYDDHAGPLGRKVNFPETAPPPDEARIAANKAGQGKPGAKKRKNRDELVAAGVLLPTSYPSSSAASSASSSSSSSSSVRSPPKPPPAPPISGPAPTVPPRAAAPAPESATAVPSPAAPVADGPPAVSFTGHPLSSNSSTAVV